MAPENRFVEALKKPGVRLLLPPEKRRTVDFRREVMPIITGKCATAQCHGSDTAKLPLSDEMTLLDVVSQSADWDRGNMSRVTIIRTGEDGENELLTYNMARMHRGDIPDNPDMQQGDIVYIPSGKGPFDWGKIRNTLWVAATILGLLRF